MPHPTPLKRILVAEGRRQSWLAAKVDRDQAEISRIVNRGLLPDPQLQRAIADALGRTPAECGWSEDGVSPASPESPRSQAA